MVLVLVVVVVVVMVVVVVVVLVVFKQPQKRVERMSSCQEHLSTLP